MKRIGFIGYGLRSETMLKAFRALEADICVDAVADPWHAQIAPGTKDDPYFAETRWYEDAGTAAGPRRSGRRVHRARAARCIRCWPAGC